MRLRDSLVSDPSGRFLPFAAARTTRGGHAGPGGPAGAPEHAPVTVATFGEDESADFVMRRAVGGDGRHAVVDFAGVGSVVLGPLRMPGSHNATNACGALVAASAFVALRSGLSGVPLSAEEMMAAAHTLSPKIARFEGLSRRTELLGRVDLVSHGTLSRSWGESTW